MPRVILGVTGGIAAYKACELLRLLVQDGHEVTPVLTDGADAFVARRTFAALARRESPDELYPHLTRADLLVVAPLSANTLAKLAHGLADNVLTQLALAFAGPVLLAPAMNTRMWEHPATQANLATLVARGAHVVGPEVGELAEGELGAGRMSEPEAIHARVRELLAGSAALAGRHVLVTAGGTREPIDAVRFVGNRSSGRMGVALARQAALRGARVTLLASNLSVEPPAGVEVVQAPSAADLARETFARAPAADLVLMAAAVADYRPASTREDKRKKGDATWTIELEATQDILAELGRTRREGQVLVGFAADVGEPGLEDARRKLERKAVNLIVFNDVSRKDIGFEAGENEVTIIGHDREHVVEKASKDAIAGAILDEAATMLERA